MATLVIAVLLGACGGSSASDRNGAPKNGKSEQSTSTTVAGDQGDAAGGSSATTAPTKRGSSTSSGPEGTHSPTGGGDGTTPTTEPPKEPTPLEAGLKAKCVKVGGKQTITFKALPGSGVAYDSRYPDGKSGISDGYYGGNAGWVIGDDGTWTDTWVIAPSAPPGTVRVVVLAGHEDYAPIERELTFELVPVTGTCPA